MSKDQEFSVQKTETTPIKDIPHTGILKSKEKEDILSHFREELSLLKKGLSPETILKMSELVSTAKNLDELRNSLRETLTPLGLGSLEENIFNIAKEVQALSRNNLEDLKLAIESLEKNKREQDLLERFPPTHRHHYLSEKFPSLKKLDSPLGENILKDIAGGMIGLLDSIIIVLLLLRDLILKDTLQLHRISHLFVKKNK